MKRLHSLFISILLTMSAACIMQLNYSVTTAAGLMPKAVNNTAVGKISCSSFISVDGGYMRVFWNVTEFIVEYYDTDYNITSRKSLAMELPLWGGFYAGADAYYIVEGQNNKDQVDSTEVIRVIRYDKGWNRIGAASITSNNAMFGGEVRFPFDYSNVNMAERGGRLYIVTGHEGYVDSAYGQGHQGFLMIAVDETTMTGNIVKCDLWHSFAQHIALDDSGLYVAEQSEGSRCTTLSRINESTYEDEKISVLNYGGSRTSAWAIDCYASVDGIAASTDNILCLGTSIDQSQYDSVTQDTAHNIYLAVTPKSDFRSEATTLKWLTNYTGGGKCFTGAYLTKINDERFMVSWEEYESEQTPDTSDTLSGSILHYVFIDGSGNVIGRELTAPAPITDCRPVLAGNNIIYYAASPNMVNFYSIDTATGIFSKKSYRVAGDDITWSLDGDVLSFTGTGDLSVDSSSIQRYPISSCRRGYISYGTNNAWKPIKDNVKKIVIHSGITSIPDQTFRSFSKLVEVVIENGLVSIGKEAFSYCSRLSSITIPASVTSIGEDILWTGSYWTHDNSHVVKATIYCNNGSTAHTYAVNNKIDYQLLDAANNKSDNQKTNKTGTQKTTGSTSDSTSKNSLKKYSFTTSKNSIKFSKLKKKSQQIIITITGGSGKITAKNISSTKISKGIKLKKKGRKIIVTFKKKSRKGTYKIQVTVNAKGDYKTTVKTFKFTVK